MKKIGIKIFVPILFLSMIFACLDKEASNQTGQPNIIIFLADDLGYGDLGAYGHPVIQTPNLDRLAQNGLKLNRFYSASPVCSPSRVGLLTGKIPNRIGVYDWIPEQSNMHIPDSVLTIPALLQDNGYSTGLFGKWHCNGKFNSQVQPQPDDLGFDHWIATQNNASPSHKDPENFVRNGKPVGKLEGFSAQLMADEVINWLSRQSENKPFFCYIPYHEPHEPIASPTHLVDQYQGAAINEDQAQYFANVTNMDHAIGRILDKLEALGKRENTLIIFTSDNGPETLGRYPGTSRSYGSPGSLRGMKVQLYEGGIRVPCIISWPKVIPANEDSDVIASALDLLPTVASVLDSKLPKDDVFDGVDMLPLWKGQHFQRKDPLFWFYPTAIAGPNIALISGDNKLLAESENKYIEPGNIAGILINNNTMEAIQKDSVSDQYFLYDLNIYLSEQQTLTLTQSVLFDSLEVKLEEEFYQLKENSPNVDLGF